MDYQSNVGLIDKVYIKCGLYRFDIARKIREMKQYTNDWLKVYMLKLGLVNTINIKFVDDYLKTIMDYDEYIREMFLFRKRVVNKIFKSLGLKFEEIFQGLTNEESFYVVNSFWAVFYLNEYRWLKVRGVDVVDVGAFVGDTPIYFVIKGAKHVYAFEPSPKHYSIAKKLIEMLGFDKKITLINAAVSSLDSKVTVIDSIISPSYQSYSSREDSGGYVRGMSLSSIRNEYGIKGGVLKVDCEGCEYGIFLSLKEEDMIWDQIQIEYHYGYMDIKNTLSRYGYNVKITRPIISYNPKASPPAMCMGWIYAYKG